MKIMYMSNSLNQGELFKEYSKNYEKDNTHKLLENSSSPDWGSIVEAFNGNDSIQQHNVIILRQMSKDERHFNLLVSKYSNLYNTYTSTLALKELSDFERIEMKMELAKQKDALLSAAYKINNDIAKLNVNDEILKEIIIEKQRNINNFIFSVVEQTPKRYDEPTVTGKIETSDLSMRSNYYHYLVYFLITMTLVAFLFNIMVNPNANALSAIYVVGALIVVFLISRYYTL